MSTQLYSSWLTTVKPKCFLPFPLPSRTNLPKEYQPGLETRLRELTVDFSLEEKILNGSKKQEVPVSAGGVQPTISSKGAELNQQDNAASNKLSSSLEVNSGKEALASQVPDKQKSKEIMNNVLDQFDTLCYEPGIASDEINNHLAELFSKNISPDAKPSSYPGYTTIQTGSTEQSSMKMPTPCSQFDATLNYQTYVDPHPRSFSPHSPSKFQQFPYDQSPMQYHFSPPATGTSAAPPLPFPKPSRCTSESEQANPGNSEKVSQLVVMGFLESRAVSALSAFGDNLDKAIEALLEES